MTRAQNAALTELRSPTHRKGILIGLEIDILARIALFYTEAIQNHTQQTTVSPGSEY